MYVVNSEWLVREGGGREGVSEWGGGSAEGTEGMAGLIVLDKYAN
jgi:hypothetical protein